MRVVPERVVSKAGHLNLLNQSMLCAESAYHPRWSGSIECEDSNPGMISVSCLQCEFYDFVEPSAGHSKHDRRS
jgi:hypothetical protein